jgi:RNA polymerase sigma-70 factor (ECF subfamily)
MGDRPGAGIALPAAAFVAGEPEPVAVLEDARRGDQDAGRRLMAEHGASMLRTARSVLGRYDGRDAEDVVQEAFVAALTTRALPSSDLGAWLRAITVRKALDAARARMRRGEIAAIDEAEDVPARSVPSADVLAVRQALSRLSAAERAVLVLVDVEGRSMKEAAATLGTTSVAVRLRAVRARRKLASLVRGER